MLVDVDWVSVSMTNVRLLINGLHKVATLIHIWWIEAPGEPSVACIFGNPGVPCDSPIDRHPGSKGS